MAYGQFGLFTCMCCLKIATEDPGVLCPDCRDTVHSLLTAIDKSPYSGAVCTDPKHGWEILIVQDESGQGWLVKQGIIDQPHVQCDTYANLMQVAAVHQKTRWVPLEVKEEV